VLEEPDPSLEPIMSRAVVKVGNRSIIKLGDKEVDYNPEFRFYLTTKLANPHYTPEISTKATICNFCVKQQARGGPPPSDLLPVSAPAPAPLTSSFPLPP
jgi:dynein heavy chain